LRILAFDAATRTGWACGSAGTVLDFGACLITDGCHRKAVRGEKMSSAGRVYAALMAEWKPEVVVLEAPFGRGVSTTRFLYGLAAVVERAAFDAGAACVELAPSSVRKKMLGHGNPPDAKSAVLAWARAAGHELLDHQTDEADALLLLECAMRDITVRPLKIRKAA
jgi:Holliday junction resolvasome RuvABC endonuclease subunit